MKKRVLTWQIFWQNTLLYLLSLVIFITAFRILRAPWLLALMWLVALGGIGVLAYQANRLTTQRAEASVSKKMKTQLQQAHDYRAKIDAALEKANRTGTQTAHREALRARVDHWTTAIEELIARVDGLQQDAIIQKDLKTVPAAIKKMEKELAATTDPLLREQLEHSLETRRKQLAALQTLQQNVRRAELQVESTLSLLGTIYSQLLTRQSSTQMANYNRLTDEVDEEVRRLEDHLSALNEFLADGT